MDKVCEELRRLLNLAKRDIFNIDDGIVRSDSSYVRTTLPKIYDNIEIIKNLLAGEKFISFLLQKNAVSFYENDKNTELSEEYIRRKIIISSHRIEIVDLGLNTVEFSSEVRELPDNLYVKGTLSLLGSGITALPENLRVDLNLILNDKIKKLPDSLYVDLGIVVPSDLYDQAVELKKRGRITGTIFKS